MSDRKKQRCWDCRVRAGDARMRCADCGGRKNASTAKRCLACRLARRELNHGRATLLTFSPEAFRALIDRSDVEWTPAMLANHAGVGVSTITRWLNGSVRPCGGEWEKVAAVLAMERCQHCGGSGTIDPTQQRIDEITASVQRRLRALPAAQPITYGDGWTLDPNALQLTIGAVTVRLTPQETALVQSVAAAPGYVTTNYLASGFRTHLSRLRAKCETAGADLGSVIETTRGAGYRARLARDEEAVS